MDTDLFLSIGVVLVILSLPSLLSAWTEGRAPRIASIMLIVAAALIITALTQRPGGYSFDEIPSTMLRVVGRYVN